jgi:osmotically-inducible protein OsmY
MPRRRLIRRASTGTSPVPGCRVRRSGARRAAGHRRPALAAAALAAAIGLAGCTPTGVAVGAGATAGVAAMQERGIKGALSDTRTRIQINDKWLQADEQMYRKVSLQVQQGRVLLTGQVPSEEMRLEAVRLAWQADGVAEVINEIEVGDSSFGDLATDTWISTQLKTDLLLDSEVYSINYSIETSNGVVYILGVARSQQEMDRVIDYARNLANVRRVVSYVRIMDAEERRRAPDQGDSPARTPRGPDAPAPVERPAA